MKDELARRGVCRCGSEEFRLETIGLVMSNVLEPTKVDFTATGFRIVCLKCGKDIAEKSTDALN